MNRYRRPGMVMLALLMLVITGAALAQDDAGAAIADGLNNPRQLFYAADGTLYIAEAGLAGDESIEGDFGPVLAGNTARVVSVPPEGGEPTVVVDNLPSAQAFENIVGANSVYVTEDGTLWIVIGNAPPEMDYARGVLVLNASGEEQRFIDFQAIEEAQNPDGEDIATNPVDIDVSADGMIYIMDASGNALYRMTADGEPEVFAVWEELPVPTSVSVGPEGDIFVGFLSAFPFPPGSARVERWSPEGELVETYEGLTAVTDVLAADDGTVYAVEMSGSFGDAGWTPNAGRVLSVSADGITPLAEGLNFPYGLAMAADGTLIVSMNSAFVEPGTGVVVPVSSDMGTAPDTAPGEPAGTPEASG